MRYYYHNITKQQFNFTDYTDLTEDMSPDDLIKYSESGDALVKPLQKGMCEGIALMFFLKKPHEEAKAIFRQIMKNNGF